MIPRRHTPPELPTEDPHVADNAPPVVHRRLDHDFDYGIHGKLALTLNPEADTLTEEADRFIICYGHGEVATLYRAGLIAHSRRERTFETPAPLFTPEPV